MEGGGTLYRGTSMDQDGRFSNKDRKLMKQISWPPEFSTKVDIKKVDLTVINPWIHRKIVEYLGDEDELLINFIISALEQPLEKGLDPRKLQIDLTGFLARNTGPFMKELWQLLIDAQNSPNGIPPILIEERKDEIKQQRQELEDELSKLESIKAFMGGNKPSRRDEEAYETDARRKEDSNISKLANKLKAEKAPSAEKEETQKESEKPSHRDRDRDRYREDRDLKERRRDRDDGRNRLRDKDREKRKERERERERDRDRRDRDRRRDKEREREKERGRERRRSPRDERKRRSKRSPSSSSGSSSSESRERSESAKKKQKQKQEKRGDNKQKEKEKQKSRNKKHESSSESESDSGSDSSSESDSSQSDSSGSDSDNGKK